MTRPPKTDAFTAASEVIASPPPYDAFGNLIHNLREVFCRFEKEVPRATLLSGQVRDRALSDHEDHNSIDVYLEGAVARAASEVGAYGHWGSRLKTEFSELLHGMLFYAQTLKAHGRTSAAAELLCAHTIGLCKNLGIEEVKLETLELSPLSHAPDAQLIAA
jgi:hypothetical protein